MKKINIPGIGIVAQSSDMDEILDLISEVKKKNEEAEKHTIINTFLDIKEKAEKEGISYKKAISLAFEEPKHNICKCINCMANDLENISDENIEKIGRENLIFTIKTIQKDLVAYQAYQMKRIDNVVTKLKVKDNYESMTKEELIAALRNKE